MVTRIMREGAEALARAAECVRAGSVIAFRTDTFYGLGADPFSVGAVRAVNELKGREGKPILVVLSDMAAAARLTGATPSSFELLAEKHWPGALTLVVGARSGLPEPLTAGTGTVGLRLPDDEAVRRLIGACGGALTATSANPAGLPPARTAAEAAAYFTRGVALVVDGGPARADKPSTVLDLTGEIPRVVREGLVARAALEETLGGRGLRLA